MRPTINITEVFDVALLQQIQDSFSDATGFATIVVDYKGNPITKYSNFSNYCQRVREDPDCLEACFRSYAHGGIQAARNGKPYVYICHGGLVELAVPIMVKGTYLGAILSGQVRISETEISTLPSGTAMPLTDFSSHPDILQLKNETKETTVDQVLASASLLKMIVNHLVERQMIDRMETELNEKNLTLMEEVRRRSQIESALKEADLKALQAQVNPHFLFNTLNSIGRLAMMEKAEKTQEMLYLFSDMMRYTLKKEKSDFVTIGEEFDHVSNYLSIQKMRLGRRLEYRVDISKPCSDVLCPFMTVQPFVENAVNYAVEPRSEGGEVLVEATMAGDHVLITIRDNGPGMPKELCDALLDGTYVPSSENRGTGIGVDNTNRRLKYYYGDRYSIQFKSILGTGTTVQISLPVEISPGRKKNV